jgi:aspartyl-tRNA(Asn)/glutamyl-tRNA(Gln) amidotransferase subunit C
MALLKCLNVLFLSNNFALYIFIVNTYIHLEMERIIEKLAGLSRLMIDAKEKEKVGADLAEIFKMIEKIGEVEIGASIPLIHMSESENVMRDDTPEPFDIRVAALHNSPKNDGDYFKVPKVVEKN